jgi:hypothetical protein
MLKIFMTLVLSFFVSSYYILYCYHTVYQEEFDFSLLDMPRSKPRMDGWAGGADGRMQIDKVDQLLSRTSFSWRVDEAC